MYQDQSSINVYNEILRGFDLQQVELGRDQITDGEVYDTITPTTNAFTQADHFFFSSQSGKEDHETNVFTDRRLEKGEFLLIKDFQISLIPASSTIDLAEIVKFATQCSFSFKFLKTIFLTCRLIELCPIEIKLADNKAIGLGQPPLGSGKIVGTRAIDSGIQLPGEKTFEAKMTVHSSALTCASVGAVVLAMRGTKINGL